jgi:hypothetical protein
MNYAVVAIGALLVLVGAGWFTWGKNQYAGTQSSTVGKPIDEVIIQDSEKV